MCEKIEATSALQVYLPRSAQILNKQKLLTKKVKHKFHLALLLWYEVGLKEQMMFLKSDVILYII